MFSKNALKINRDDTVGICSLTGYRLLYVLSHALVPLDSSLLSLNSSEHSQKKVLMMTNTLYIFQIFLKADLSSQ